MQTVSSQASIEYRDNFGYLLPYQDLRPFFERRKVTTQKQQHASPLRTLSFEKLCRLPQEAQPFVLEELTQNDWINLSNTPGFPELIAIVGPTASGKTALADELAYNLSCSVLSLDSMQVYKGMNIGTAKVDQTQLKSPLVGVDLVQAQESYSVQEFQNFARNFIAQQQALGKVVVLCGGTGLYLNAVVDSYEFPAGTQRNNPIRKKYQDYLNAEGVDALWNLLASRDSASAQLIHPHNTKRVIRALEMLEEDICYHEQSKNLRAHSMHYRCAFVGCACERSYLYERINKRVDNMFDRGLLKEFEQLKAQGAFQSLTASQAIGYRELLEHPAEPELARELIKQHSRHYAKRQLSWFYKDGRMQWISTQDTSVQDQLKQLYAWLRYLTETKAR